MSAEEACRRIVARLGDEPLLTGPGGHVRLRLADGPIQRLVAWTHEDKAAKGLRKLGAGAAPQPPIHFTVAEMAQETPALLLTADAGSGRTTLARDLARSLARARLAGAWPAGDPVDRNDLGDALPQSWNGPLPMPVLVTARPGVTLAGLVAEAGPPSPPDAPVLVIVDDLERAGPGATALLAEGSAMVASRPGLRLLALADSTAAAAWRLTAGWTRLGMVPLLAAQRRRFIAAHGLVQAGASALSPAAANASLFALASLRPGDGETEEAIIEDWLAGAGLDPAALCDAAAATLAGAEAPALPTAARPRRVLQLLAARSLARLPSADIAERFSTAPALWAPVVASLLRTIDPAQRDGVAEALVAVAGDAGALGALLAAGCVGPGSRIWPAIESALVASLGTSSLTARQREEAGRILARHGDPRDLEALAHVPGGTFTMGAAEPENSAPPHTVTVGSFHMGVHPVTNEQYARFVTDTGRAWRSPEHGVPERRSAPATDLTWRDACAYCAWLTLRWRADGRIGSGEVVRLPTEPEWERAARGDQTGADGAVVYPWAGPWNPDAVNGEETGFNDTCTVGIFPAGRSPYGCLDMAGQVWEWVSTLWGEDMAKPSFAYPYRDDGREDREAGPSVRRGLRGGCFSSGAPKACCTYRGSLEPDGFWRGNGFRIVVAPT